MLRKFVKFSNKQQIFMVQVNRKRLSSQEGKNWMKKMLEMRQQKDDIETKKTIEKLHETKQ